MTRRGSRSKPSARRPRSRRRPPRQAAVFAQPTEEGRADQDALVALWKLVWPFPTTSALDGLKAALGIRSGLAELSGRPPDAVIEAFPLVFWEEMVTLRDEMTAEYRPIEAGQNADFERAVRVLAPFGVPREDLIKRTDCALPAYRLARTLSDRIENMRPAVTKATARLRAARRLLEAPTKGVVAQHLREQAPHLLAPGRPGSMTPAACAELDAALAYLADIPTKAALKTWRRKIRLNRLGDDPWQLSVWTQVGGALVLYLEQARHAADARRELPPPLKRPAFAYQAAHALLYARYPDVVPDDPMALRRRIERSAP